jgi:glutamate synthase domain-containing protein 3
VDLEPLEVDDVEYLQNMLRKHFDYTRSGRADDILRKWDTFAPKFVKVFPQEYRAALEQMADRTSG